MTKPHVLEEFVAPLLKHIENIQREAIAKNCDQEIIDKIKKVHENVEIAEKVVQQVINWEGKLIDIFGEIERHMNCMLDGSGDQISTSELRAAEKKTEEVMTMIERRNMRNYLIIELGDVKKKNLPGAKTPDPSQQSIAEVGQSSNTEISHHGVGNAEFPNPLNVKEIIEQNLELTLCCYSLFVFPKNTEFKKRFVIYWWIGLHLLQTENNETVEDTANKNFNKLVELGVLVPLKKAYNGRVDGCTIEPQVHAQLIEAAKRNIIQDKFSSKCGHFHVSTITANQIELGVLTNFGLNYLKSSQITDCDKSLALNTSFELRAMLLGLCSMEPHHIELDKTDFLRKLKPSLTYLSLHGISRITELPDSIGNLVNLIVLDLRACHNLEKLPQKIKSMNMLTHLDVSMCYLLDHLPKWVGSLINLEVLKGFVLGSLRNEDKCRLSDLTQLKNLRKLTMVISRVSEVEQKEVESLKALAKLKSLTISWGKEGCDEIKEKISPPNNLEKLDFRCYPKEEMPEWFDPEVLNNLKRLYIRGGMLKRFVKKGWNVEILRLRFLQKFEIPWRDVSDMFTELKLVECVKCVKMPEIYTVDRCWRKEREIHFVFLELLELKPELGRLWRDGENLKKLKELLEQSEQELKLREQRLTKSNKQWQNEEISRELRHVLRMLLDEELIELWLNEQKLRELCELLYNNLELMRMFLLAKWLSELLKNEIDYIFWEVLENEKWEQRLRKRAELLEQKLMSRSAENLQLVLEQKVSELSGELDKISNWCNHIRKQFMRPWISSRQKNLRLSWWEFCKIDEGIEALEQFMERLEKELLNWNDQQEQWEKKISELWQWVQGDVRLFLRQKLDKLHREEQGLRELRELLEKETELQQPEVKSREQSIEQEPKSSNLLGQKMAELWKQEVELSEMGLLLEQEPNSTELIRKKKEKLMGLEEVLEQTPETKEVLEEKLEELRQSEQKMRELREQLEQKSKSTVERKKKREYMKLHVMDYGERRNILQERVDRMDYGEWKWSENPKKFGEMRMRQKKLDELRMREQDIQWVQRKLWKFEDDLIELSEEMDQEMELTHLSSLEDLIKKLLEQKRELSQPKLMLTILQRIEKEIGNKESA